MEYQMYDKFEYKVKNVSNYSSDLEKELNNLGQEGWELISFSNSRLILKRKLQCLITE